MYDYYGNYTDFSLYTLDEENIRGSEDKVVKTKERRPVGQYIQESFRDYEESSESRCYVRHATGKDTIATIADFGGGTIADCREQGKSAFCKLEIRTVRNEIRQIITGCAQGDYCAAVRNFASRAMPLPPSVAMDECKPTTHNGGNTYMLNARYRNHESFCRTCFNTNDGSIDGTNSGGLFVTGNDIFILDGNSPAAPIHASSVSEWTYEMWRQHAFQLQST